MIFKNVDLRVHIQMNRLKEIVTWIHKFSNIKTYIIFMLLHKP